jgi:Ser/Thr protein kinase RdoA (MazF antagonist)
MRGAGLPDTWHATLMTWVDGRLLAHHLTGANLEKMGTLAARLHIHGKSWKPPSGFTTRRFEAYLSRGEPDVLFSDAVLQTFGEQDRRAFLRARGWVDSEYAQLDRDDLRVIHCDLWHENVKLDRGRLRPFDFEDTVWGYRAHDIAMGMLDLLETVGTVRYRDLLAAFRQGYERLLDWPEGNLAVLQIGRLLWKANYVARFAGESLGPMVQEYGCIFRSFEQTGELRLPG